MRFMTLIKFKENGSFGPPPPQLFQAIAKLGGEAAQAGVLVDTAGLLPAATGARVRVDGGRIATSAGQVGSDQEVVSGYAVFNVRSKEEAIDWATRFMELHLEHWKGWEGETEVRQLIQAPEASGGERRG